MYISFIIIITISYSCRVTEWPYWFGLILPFSVIYVFNWLIFAIIMIKLLGRKNIINPEKGMAENVKKNLLIAVGLSLLFGLGWGFGLTATSSGRKEATFAFQLLFSIFVGLQGVLILFFHGIRSSEFRQVWASAFGVKKKQKIFSSSFNPRKKQAGSEASTTCNLSALPSNVDSKSQTEQVDSTDYPQGFSTFIENEVSIAKEPSLVVEGRQ